MKIVHSADWHLGNRMHKVERGGEFKAFLSWLKTEIEKEKAETLVVAGDIFDTVNPPTDSRTQYNVFLASLLGTCCKNVVVVGGNHDSGSLLDSEKEILEALNIHVIGSIGNVEPKDMVFELVDGQGKVNGICCAVPYAHEVELRKYCPDDREIEKGTFHDISYGELYRQVAEEAEKLRGGRDIPIIATGHLYAANLEGRFSGENVESSESDDGKRALDGVMGNLGSVHENIFPETFDYVALGHIHYPTMVNKNPKIRYSGSPFILGFDEHDIKHGVLSVEIEKGKEPAVRKVEVPRIVDWLRISGKGSEIKKTLEGYIANPPEKETNLEVYYTWEEEVDINELLIYVIEKLPSNVAVVHFKRNEEQDVGTASSGALDDFEDENVSNEEIFRTLILNKYEFVKEGLSEEELKNKEQEILDTYLPLFLEAAQAFEGGARIED